MLTPESRIEITREDVYKAYLSAYKHHSGKRDAFKFTENLDENIRKIFNSLPDHSYTKFISYSRMRVVNNNGKERMVMRPSFTTRVLQHLFVNKIRPLYDRQDPLVSFNCKPGFGINTKSHGVIPPKCRSALTRMKHFVYDLNDFEYFLSIDQRKCYEHVKESVFRKQLKRFTTDRWFIDFAVNVSFVKGMRGIPIGTPSSPVVHHILMANFDHYVFSVCKHTIRYADNVFMIFRTKEEANTAKWRVMNYWWYVLHIRPKRREVYIGRLDKPFDFLGYCMHRNNQSVCSHNKGYTTVRNSTLKKAFKSKSQESYASYFGILTSSDSYRILNQIENDMKLKSLTDKIRIDRNMDARNIDIKDIVGVPVDLVDYEIRYDAKGEANWIKCLIGMPEHVDGVLTGKRLAREFHGNYNYIIQFLLLCEKEYKKENILPIEDVVIEKQCGFIFKDSTNMIDYIEKVG